MVWPLGYDCCQFPGFGSVNLDFVQGGMTINLAPRHQNLNATSGSASDTLGNILFTSNGFYITNAIDDTMQNGSGLNPSYYTNQHKTYGLPLHQGNLVIPSLTNSDQYILFHNTIDDYFNTLASLFLYTSTIDMSLNGGLGGVINKNTVLLSDSMTPGRLTATRHANGRDWWIFAHAYGSSDLLEFLYTPNGILGPTRKPLLIARDFYLGQCGFNPQGNKFAYFESLLGLEIADFNRCSGEFTNIQSFQIMDSSDYGAGMAFSPNGRYLYVSTVEYLYQYDTWSSNIDSSRLTVGIYDGFTDTVTTSNGTYFWLMALAPDGKIYMSCANSSTSLHVINSPDSMGLSCDFCQHCIQLPVVNAFTMPNFPNYTLGREFGSVCDSLTNDISTVKIENLISIYPNPSHEKLTVKFLSQPNAELLIYDHLGKEKFQISLEANRNEFILDVSNLNSGIYYCKLTGKLFFEVVRFSVQH